MHMLCALVLGCMVLLGNGVITDAITAANSQTFGYDALNRLTSASSGAGGYGTLGYVYNANGTATSTTSNGVTTSFTVAAGSNRLTAVGAQTVTTNANGSITGFSPALPSGVSTLAYDASSRLASVSGASGTLASYVYDAFGSRIKKVAGSKTTLYITGAGNSLLTESTNGVATDIIYANGTPVANYNTLLSIFRIYFIPIRVVWRSFK